jgi:uncharacterized protein (TIGR00299 family) protein
MRLIYFDCSSGVSGDMALGALLDIYGDRESFLRELHKIGLPGEWDVDARRTGKHGITGYDVGVSFKEGHAHRGLKDIVRIIEGSALNEAVKRTAAAIFTNLAEAEGKVHCIPAGEVHFHEVGAVDAVIDIVGTAILVDFLKPDVLYCSPILAGSGTVKCAHGVLPVPAPAAAELLKGFTIYSDGVEGERATPTGAAILKTLCKPVKGIPPMRTERIGYGFGKKDFGGLNALRILMGEAEEGSGDVCVLEANIDDMTGEALGAAMQVFLEAGALDAWFTPAYMKKQRPAYVASVMCRPEEKDKFARLFLTHTSTIGVRSLRYERTALERSETVVDTSFGPVRVKTAIGPGIIKRKPEYEDILKIANEKGMPFETVCRRILAGLDDKSE